MKDKQTKNSQTSSGPSAVTGYANAKEEYIVSLYGGTQFLAQWAGDPGRTCIRDSAKRYKSEFAAHCALGYAKRNFPYRDYSEAKVVKP